MTDTAKTYGGALYDLALNEQLVEDKDYERDQSQQVGHYQYR